MGLGEAENGRNRKLGDKGSGGKGGDNGDRE